jgi:uncharacterized protein (DUF952 family)
MIFHLTDAAAWVLALERGELRPASLQAQGFVHLSTGEQVLGTANRFFAGRTDLLLLQVDETQLQAGLKYEEGEVGQLFPHFYGPLPLPSILKAVPLKPDAAGIFVASPESLF